MPTRRRSLPSALALAASIAIVAAAAGCGTRTIRETLYEDPSTRIVLRHQTEGGEIVDRGYNHPLAIAPVRLAHILSRIDVRVEAKKGAERVPALPTESLYALGDQLSKALRAADSSEEIAVYYIRRSKRFGIFDRRNLYSFVAYALDDLLYIHLSRVNDEIGNTSKDDRLPEPHVGDYVMEFRVVPSKGMTLVDGQSVAVAWRSPVFKKESRTRIAPTGEVIRRTILMESPEPEAENGAESSVERLPENLSSDTLRELADLEDQRHRGEITEAEYNVRRRQIIRSDPASK